MSGKEHPSGRVGSLLLSTLVYAGIASVGTGVMLNGIYFISRDVLGFDDRLNLLLGLAVQAPYIPAALASGRLSRRIGARTLLSISVLGMTLACAGLALLPPTWMWWLLAPLYNACAGMQWPIVESYIASGRLGRDMRRAIGLFNVTWAATIAPGLWLISVMHHMPRVTFIVLVVLHASTLALVVRWPLHPPAHDAEAGRQHTGEAYPNLLRSSRVLLLVSYVLIYMLSPLLPGVFERLGVAAAIAPALSSTWVVVRVGVFFAMYWRPGWHGRWIILGAGAALLIGGAVVVLFEWAVWLALVGLVLLGIGQGMIYYAALYYGMAVEHAAVDSGGRHEAVIGVGYILGPTLGLAGQQFAVGAAATGGALLMTGAVSTMGVTLAMHFYLNARRARAALRPPPP